MVVGSSVTLVVIYRVYRKVKVDFLEIWHRSSASVPNLTINFSEVKVKGQGQNPSTEIRTLAIARPCMV